MMGSYRVTHISHWLQYDMMNARLLGLINWELNISASCRHSNGIPKSLYNRKYDEDA